MGVSGQRLVIHQVPWRRGDPIDVAPQPVITFLDMVPLAAAAFDGLARRDVVLQAHEHAVSEAGGCCTVENEPEGGGGDPHAARRRV